MIAIIALVQNKNFWIIYIRAKKIVKKQTIADRGYSYLGDIKINGRLSMHLVEVSREIHKDSLGNNLW